MGQAKNPQRPGRTRPAVVLATLGVAVTLMVGLVVAGVLAAALAARVESPEVWSRWASVGDAFGVLNGVLSGMAVVGLVVALWVQFRELSLQRSELRLQRDAIVSSGEELRRSADANLRMLHFELLKMAIDDPALAEVWPDPANVANEQHGRQLLYANLVFQHLSLSMLVAGYDDEQIREALRYTFDSSLMREYWRLAQRARARTQVPGSDAWRVARLGDEVLAELAAAAGDGCGRSPAPDAAVS